MNYRASKRMSSYEIDDAESSHFMCQDLEQMHNLGKDDLNKPSETSSSFQLDFGYPSSATSVAVTSENLTPNPKCFLPSSFSAAASSSLDNLAKQSSNQDKDQLRHKYHHQSQQNHSDTILNDQYLDNNINNNQNSQSNHFIETVQLNKNRQLLSNDPTYGLLNTTRTTPSSSSSVPSKSHPIPTVQLSATSTPTATTRTESVATQSSSISSSSSGGTQRSDSKPIQITLAQPGYSHHPSSPLVQLVRPVGHPIAHHRSHHVNHQLFHQDPDQTHSQNPHLSHLNHQLDPSDLDLDGTIPPPRRAYSSVVAPLIPDLYSQFRVPTHPMFTSSQYDSSALLDNYPSANYHPQQAHQSQDLIDLPSVSSSSAASIQNQTHLNAATQHSRAANEQLLQQSPYQANNSATGSAHVPVPVCVSEKPTCSSMLSQNIIMNQHQQQQSHPNYPTADLYNSNSDYDSKHTSFIGSQPYSQQMNSGRVNAFATQQRLDTTCGGVGPGQPSLGQYATSGFCASENMASGRTDFDFPSDLSLSDLPSTIADAAQSQQEQQQQQQQQQAAHQQQSDLNTILSFDSPDDDIIPKELQQMPFPDSGDPFVPGPSHVDSEGNNLANGTTLGPLQIDVGVAGALADSLNGDRRRHRTDPGIITQRISTYLHSAAPSSDLSNGGAFSSEMNGRDRNGNDKRLIALSDAQQPIDCSSISTNNNNNNNNMFTNNAANLNNPLRMHRRSKGKPENVCQLLASMEQRISASSYFDSSDPSTGAILRKQSALSTLQHHKKSRNGMMSQRNANANDPLRGRSISINVAEFRHRSFITNAFKQFSSQLRSPRFFESITQNALQQLAPYTPPPMLSPKRNGSGLFWQLARSISQASQVSPSTSQPLAALDQSTKSGGDDGVVKSEVDEDQPEKKRVRLDRHHSTNSSNNSSSAAGTPSAKRSLVDETQPPTTPLRKNGFCYATQPNTNLLDIEAIRKESSESKSSSLQSANLISSAVTASTAPRVSPDETLRKDSPTSMDDDLQRKISSVSDSYEEDVVPPESDATPHINRGKDYQAKVKKWADREITDEEREAIPDRDDAVFDCNLIDHLEPCAVEAYELLACSQAVPRPGRNRELALHLLMENKGNIQAAVMDLMRSDTLDWEQYPIIYNNIYNDTDPWTPEDVQSFQDAIYKSEKDFHQVARDLGNKTVKQCVEFYYMWKKACPDDYRKLRNLRRKRQLLEMHQQMEPGESYNLRSSARNADGEEGSETSEAESDATYPSYATDQDQVLQDERLDKGGVLNLAAENIVPTGTQQQRKTSATMRLHDGANDSAAAVIKQLSPTVISESLATLAQQQSCLSQRTSTHHHHHATVHRTPVKKGAQPSADGYFHCRLCDKCFEKVKSLNAHMKSHAMKARAEAEAQAQLNLQFGAQAQQAQRTVQQAPQAHQNQQHSQAHQQHRHQQQAVAPTPRTPVCDKQPTVVSPNSSATVPSIAATNSAMAAAHHNALAQSPLARVAQNLSQNPFGALAQPGLAQDLFVQTSLAGDQLAQSTLMQSPLGQASLAAHSALGQSLTAASVLSQLPQAQALHFLNTLHHPTLTQ